MANLIIKIQNTEEPYRTLESSHDITYVAETFNGVTQDHANEFLMRAAEYQFCSVEKFNVSSEQYSNRVTTYEFTNQNDADRFIHWFEETSLKATETYHTMRG